MRRREYRFSVGERDFIHRKTTSGARTALNKIHLQKLLIKTDTGRLAIEAMLSFHEYHVESRGGSSLRLVQVS